MKPIVVIFALSLFAGCASAPPAAPPPAATANAPLNGNMVRSAIAPTSDAEKDNASWARSQGYRLQKRDDKVMWCRAIAEIGTKISHNDCVSDDSIVEMRRVYEANKQELQNALKGCSGGSACGQK